MTHYDSLLKMFESEIRSSLGYLEHSHNKIQALSTDPSKLNADTLETWESYVARFARVTDIFLSKYIRSYILHLDPAFRAELRDFVDKAEKNNLISSADRWMEVRELRNKTAHEYSRSELKRTFESVKDVVPFVVLELRKLFP
ncbi:MAG: nucleotidyltransferase substrate binding protein [Oligoflexales bacterium]|nr:nucleotidyltransferase substrate binding protein [Oligoflexales bacterium]